MTESAPVDPTSTDGWKKLAGIADGFTPDLRGWFDSDPVAPSATRSRPPT